MNSLKQIIPPLIPLAILLILLEILVGQSILPSFLVPAPSSVFEALGSDSRDLFEALTSTGVSAALGFIVSALGGILLGILFSLTPWIQRAFMPYAIFFQTVPIIAIAPLLVIWIGYGQSTVIASAAIVSIFPMIASTLSGLQSTEVPLRELFKLYRASAWDQLFKLRLPSAWPQILVGLKISAGLSVIGAIVGEFIAGGGLGGYIDVARTRQRVDQLFAALILSSLIGLVFVAATNFLGRKTLKRWHASER